MSGTQFPGKFNRLLLVTGGITSTYTIKLRKVYNISIVTVCNLLKYCISSTDSKAKFKLIIYYRKSDFIGGLLARAFSTSNLYFFNSKETNIIFIFKNVILFIFIRVNILFSK